VQKKGVTNKKAKEVKKWTECKKKKIRAKFVLYLFSNISCELRGLAILLRPAWTVIIEIN
jgi:protein-disulfide isomerase